MSNRRLLLQAFGATILTTASLLSGCEQHVDPVIGTDAPYSFFGVLSPQLDTQSIRVYSIDGILEPIPNAPLDAQFESENLTTGERRTWSDSIIVEADGMNAHVFLSAFRAGFDETYRLTATRSDGATSTATVAVPPFSELVLPPSLDLPPAVIEAVVTGTPPNLIRVEVTYEYRYTSFSGIERDKTTVSYDGVGSQGLTGFVIPIQVGRDLSAILAFLTESTGFDVELKLAKMTVRLIVANLEWKPPGGRFDPDIIVQPGTLSNVENGFGFVGAGFRLTNVWNPRDTLLLKLGQPVPADVTPASITW